MWKRLAWDVIKQELREGDFDASGCPKYWFTASTDYPACLSFQAVRDNIRLVKAAHRNPQLENRQWMLMDVGHNYFDRKMVCAHTGLPIPSKEEIDEAEATAELVAQYG